MHGITGPVAILSGATCAWLEDRFNLPAVRVSLRGNNPELDAALLALAVVAAAHRASAGTTAPAPDPERARNSEQLLGTAAAAELLHCTDRAIRLAIAENRLTATRHAGRWLIHPEDLDNYRAARAA